MKNEEKTVAVLCLPHIHRRGSAFEKGKFVEGCFYASPTISFLVHCLLTLRRYHIDNDIFAFL